MLCCADHVFIKVIDFCQAQPKLHLRALFLFPPDKPMGRPDKPMGCPDKPMERTDKLIEHQ
jgi:hypothetical protein